MAETLALEVGLCPWYSWGCNVKSPATMARAGVLQVGSSWFVSGGSILSDGLQVLFEHRARERWGPKASGSSKSTCPFVPKQYQWTSTRNRAAIQGGSGERRAQKQSMVWPMLLGKGS